MAKAEGWYTKQGSKWPTMPDLMLSYRAAAFWSRMYEPGLTMGIHTSEEVEDMGAGAQPVQTARTEDLNAKLQNRSAAVVEAQVIPPTPEPNTKAKAKDNPVPTAPAPEPQDDEFLPD